MNVSIYSELIDKAVIRLPGRTTPGSVIQGDTLYLMHAEMMDILEELKHHPGSDLFYRVYKLTKGVEERLQHYIEVCESQGVPVNFAIEYSVLDYEDLLI